MMNNAINYNIQPNYQELPQHETVITGGGVNFNFLKNNEAKVLLNPNIPDIEVTTPVKRRGRPKKEDKDIIKASGEVISETISSYNHTNDLLNETICEIDTMTVDLKNELDAVRSSRTMKNKYMYIGDLSGNIGALLSTKIQAIKELNNSIAKSNDLDYKRQKDMNALNSQDTDQQLFDMYNAFINTPINSGNTNSATSLGPNTLQMTLAGQDNIIRADGGNTLDVGFQNFQQNMTPSQRLMIMEDDVKDVLVYDQATGQKYFDKVDNNGNSVPGLERRDPMFLEDYTIDIRNKIARNINLNDSMPVIILNEDKKFEEY